ncbi:hypothetical protein ACFL3H_07745 [Gemmatimonadota bacterium]
MTATFKTLLKKSAGAALVGVGVVGMIVPGIQGVVTLSAGLLLLYPEDTEKGRRIREWIRQKEDEAVADLEYRRKNRPRSGTARRRPF